MFARPLRHFSNWNALKRAILGGRLWVDCSLPRCQLRGSSPICGHLPPRAIGRERGTFQRFSDSTVPAPVSGPTVEFLLGRQRPTATLHTGDRLCRSPFIFTVSLPSSKRCQEACRSIFSSVSGVNGRLSTTRYGWRTPHGAPHSRSASDNSMSCKSPALLSPHSTRCSLSWPSASGQASDNPPASERRFYGPVLTPCDEFDVTFGIWLGAQT